MRKSLPTPPFRKRLELVQSINYLAGPIYFLRVWVSETQSYNPLGTSFTDRAIAEQLFKQFDMAAEGLPETVVLAKLI